MSWSDWNDVDWRHRWDGSPNEEESDAKFKRTRYGGRSICTVLRRFVLLVLATTLPANRTGGLVDVPAYWGARSKA